MALISIKSYVNIIKRLLAMLLPTIATPFGCVRLSQCLRAVASLVFTCFLLGVVLLLVPEANAWKFKKTDDRALEDKESINREIDRKSWQYHESRLLIELNFNQISHQTEVLNRLIDRYRLEKSDIRELMPSAVGHWYAVEFKSLMSRNEIDIKQLQEEIQSFKGIERADLDYKMERFWTTPSDPLYPQQWALPMIQMPTAWSGSSGPTSLGQGVKVAIIDSGYRSIADMNHGVSPSCTDSTIIGEFNAVNFITGGTPLTGPGAAWDIDGHGTGVTSIIAACTNNSIGGAGIASRAHILPVRVFDDNHIGYNSYVAQGIYHAAAVENVDIMNLSLGSYCDTTWHADPSQGCSASILNMAIQIAVNQDVVIVAASGNQDANYLEVSHPANHPNVIAVGATGPAASSLASTTKTAYSNAGCSLDLVAPGGDLVSGQSNGVLWKDLNNNAASWVYQEGTSLSAPHVAAAAAIILGAYPNYTAAEVRYALTSHGSVQDLGPQGFDAQTGHGLLQLGDALAQAAAGLPGYNATPSADNCGNTPLPPIVQANLVDPDFVLGAMYIDNVVTDPNTLQIQAGSDASVWVVNNGASINTGSIELLIYEDTNMSGAFDSGDTSWTHSIAAPFAYGESKVVQVPLAGQLAFRNNRLHAVVDPNNVFVEIDETNNAAGSELACQAPSVIDPKLLWSWGNNQLPKKRGVLTSPLVADVDNNGTENIIFITTDDAYVPTPQTTALIVLEGLDGTVVTDAPISNIIYGQFEPMVMEYDATNPGLEIIIAQRFSGQDRILILDYQGNILKSINVTGGIGFGGGTHLNIANSTYLGKNIFTANRKIFDESGTQICYGPNPWQYDYYDRVALSVPQFLDANSDGKMDVLYGHLLWDETCTKIWEHPRDAGESHMVSALANFDADSDPEIVISSTSVIRMVDIQNNLIWRYDIPTHEQPVMQCNIAIGDIDGDGMPDIVHAGKATTWFNNGIGGNYITALSHTGTGYKKMGFLEYQPVGDIGDCGSVFLADLNGDGKDEILVRALKNIAVLSYDNENNVLKLLNSFGQEAGTAYTEHVTVADVTGDGHAEIIDPVYQPGTGTSGLYVYENNPAYAPFAKMLNERLGTEFRSGLSTLPSPSTNWMDVRRYASNQLTVPALGQSEYDLSVSQVSADFSNAPSTILINGLIGNGGKAPAVDVRVEFYNGDPFAGGTLFDTLTSAQIPALASLNSGQYLSVTGTYNSPPPSTDDLYVLVYGLESECDQLDNMLSTAGYVTDTDLALVKSANVSTVSPGDNVTYQLAVSSLPASTTITSGVIQVTDTLDASVFNVNAFSLSDVTVPTGWSCSVNASGANKVLDCHSNNGTHLMPGQNVVIDFIIPVKLTALGSISNTANLLYGADTDASNNTSTATILSQTPVMSMAKTLLTPVVSNGQLANFRLEAIASGNGNTVAVVQVKDMLDASKFDISGVNFTQTPVGWSCYTPNQMGSNELLCETNTGTVLTAGSSIIEFSVPVNGSGNLANCAVVSYALQSDAQDCVSAVIHNVDISIVKSTQASTVLAGSVIGFELTVSAQGTTSTNGVVSVSDTLDANWFDIASITTANVSAPTGWSCTVVSALINCTTGSMSPGQSDVIQIQAPLLAGMVGTLNNTASVSYVLDTNSSNNSSTVSVVSAVPDLVMNKVVNQTKQTSGMPVNYTLAIQAQGFGSTSGVITVTDTLDATAFDLSTFSWVSYPIGWNCNIVSNLLSCSTSQLMSAGQSAAIVFSIATNAGYQGVVDNTASVSYLLDPELQNNSDTVSFQSVVPDLRIKKTSTQAGYISGGAVGFNLEVTNIGQGTALAGLTLTDSLPFSAQSVFQNITITTSNPLLNCTYSNPAVTCNYGQALPPGAKVSATIQAKVEGRDDFTNCASTSVSNEPASLQNNNQSCVTVEPLVAPTITTPNPKAMNGYYQGAVTNVLQIPVFMNDDKPSNQLTLTVSSPQQNKIQTLTASPVAVNGTSTVTFLPKPLLFGQGLMTLQLTVTDADGLSATTQMQVNVKCITPGGAPCGVSGPGLGFGK